MAADYALEKIRARLSSKSISLPPGPLRIGRYGDSAALSRSLIGLILQGEKRAGTGLLWAYEADGESLPASGDLEVVVDEFDEPIVLTRITRVDVVRFDAVTASYAAREGEGDRSLEHWRAAHWEFFPVSAFGLVARLRWICRSCVKVLRYFSVSKEVSTARGNRQGHAAELGICRSTRWAVDSARSRARLDCARRTNTVTGEIVGHDRTGPAPCRAN